MQSKKHSVIESFTNTLLGLLLSFSISQLFWEYEKEIQTYIWTNFVWHISSGANVVVTLVLTVVSVIRGYILRRIFNRKTCQRRIFT